MEGGQEGRGGHGVILEDSRQRGSPWSPDPKKTRREAAGGCGGSWRALISLSGAGTGRVVVEWGGPWPSPQEEPSLTLAPGDGGGGVGGGGAGTSE